MITGIALYIILAIIIVLKALVIWLLVLVFRLTNKSIENQETFSRIAVAIDAKLNTLKISYDIEDKEVTDILALLIPTARIVLETKVLISSQFSKENPAEAHAEGKKTGASVEAMEMAKAGIMTKKPPSNEASTLTSEINEALAPEEVLIIPFDDEPGPK